MIWQGKGVPEKPVQGGSRPREERWEMRAAAARASFLATQVRDLLVLEKPFGVAIVAPVELLQQLRL